MLLYYEIIPQKKLNSYKKCKLTYLVGCKEVQKLVNIKF